MGATPARPLSLSGFSNPHDCNWTVVWEDTKSGRNKSFLPPAPPPSPPPQSTSSPGSRRTIIILRRRHFFASVFFFFASFVCVIVALLPPRPLFSTPRMLTRLREREKLPYTLPQVALAPEFVAISALLHNDNNRA